MPESTSLKRNTDDEVLPQGYSEELADWKEVIVDEEGKQYVRDTEVLAKLTEMDNKLQTLEDTVDLDGNQKVAINGNLVEEEKIAEQVEVAAGAETTVAFGLEADFSRGVILIDADENHNLSIIINPESLTLERRFPNRAVLILDNEATDGLKQMSEPFLRKSKEFRVRIINHDTESRTYDVYLQKIVD